ncbi:MAG: hypothetical protein MI923_17220 [Phycisphaerales bacterium]|nr:hypothetical protein [Phycisphaerales bacterium]
MIGRRYIHFEFVANENPDRFQRERSDVSIRLTKTDGTKSLEALRENQSRAFVGGHLGFLFRDPQLVQGHIETTECAALRASRNLQSLQVIATSRACCFVAAMNSVAWLLKQAIEKIYANPLDHCQ